MNALKPLPPLHLWIYNHPMVGISDQLEFFLLIMKQHDYSVSCSRKPRLDALNVVIENFSENSSQTLIDFCEQTGKRVALIMTEHLDLQNGEILIHGERLWNNNDYMHPAMQAARVKNLMDCLPYLRTLWVLGDLPQLKGADQIFPGLAVRRLPFPTLPLVDVASHAPEVDFIFTGIVTAFREQRLRAIAATHSLKHTTQLVSRNSRDQMNKTARWILNIPQRSDWRWLSLMRVFAALRCGRATVSLATQDTSRIASCCLQLDEADWASRIGHLLADWRQSYWDAHQRYEDMRSDFAKEHRFPSDLIEYWSLLEKRCL